MKKIYVLDTSVLLQDPMAIFKFQDNEVVIPSVVLEEVDSKKRNMDEIGRNARQVSRIIDSLRLKGKLSDGVTLDNDGLFRVELNHKSFQKMQDTFLTLTNDNRIIAVALNLKEEQDQGPDPRPVILVSKDALVRVKADSLEIRAEDYLSDRVITEDKSYAGYTTLYVQPEVINAFYQQGKIPINFLGNHEVFYPHEFILLKDELGSSKSAIGKINKEGNGVQKLVFDNETIWGIRGRNAQQWMALELLMNSEIALVTLVGKAGTGKTLLSLAAALCQVEDEKKYKKLLVARPIVPLGKDIGFLPGEKEEKLRPWVQPIYDNLEYLFNAKNSAELDKILAGLGSLQVEALTYIRGRSIPEQFIIIDEAQNLTKHEVKTILTRVGEGSKIIIMGDPQQIDHPYLDETNNGLVYVVEKFKSFGISGHVRLEKGERSSLAQLAADIL